MKKLLYLTAVAAVAVAACKKKGGNDDLKGVFITACDITVATTDLLGAYSWEEAQTACPAGWRLPTHEELSCLCVSEAYKGLNLKGGYWSNPYLLISDDGCAEIQTLIAINTACVRCVKDK